MITVVSSPRSALGQPGELRFDKTRRFEIKRSPKASARGSIRVDVESIPSSSISVDYVLDYASDINPALDSHHGSTFYFGSRDSYVNLNFG
ncbi:hypothetical protein EVAR_67373_1 [Eumeta japonica]|uniref:Uncharacterized protein n=1 Tax=Eumeta variegata TaxID=151549 RepID=A0A4C1ZVE1_EUMVA|nr:hypothetical protein EVAR_67373_1 [Eumeta japonica]